MILNINAEDSAVTLVLVGHGEDLEIFAVPALTNWNPGRIFLFASSRPSVGILICWFWFQDPLQQKTENKGFPKLIQVK